MLGRKTPNAAGSSISVTTTATKIIDLVNTASGTTSVNAGLPSDVNGLDITPEDGDIRYLDSGHSPTATEGMLIKEGSTYHLRHLDISRLELISVTGTVKCSVRFGSCTPYESDSISRGDDVTINAGDLEIGAVEIKNATTDDRATVDTNGNLSVINEASLVPEEYNYIALTYVAAGNGVGEVETATYKTGGSGGSTVATLTLTYDASNRVASVTRS